MSIITYSQASRKPKTFFEGKKAILKQTISNLLGETIPENSEVIIEGIGHSKLFLNIHLPGTDIHIRNVWCENLELCN